MKETKCKTIRQLRDISFTNPVVDIFNSLTGRLYYLGNLDNCPYELDACIIKNYHQENGILYLSVQLP